MYGTAMEVYGGEELELALKRLPDAIQDRVLSKAFTKGAAIIRKAVRDRVPGSGEKHRKLRRGIKTRVGRKRRRGLWRSVDLPEREELGVDPKDKHYWPAALEYGHDNVAARSFLRAGYDVSESRVERVVVDALRKGADEEWAKL